MTMRIAFLVRAYPTVSETFIQDQVDGLRERGHSVDVYALYVGKPAPHQPPDAQGARYLIGPELPLPSALARAVGRSVRGLANPVALLRLATVLPRHPRIAGEAVHALRTFGSGRSGRGYDVVHAHYGPTGLLALALRRAGVLSGPLVTTFHGIDLARYPLRHGKDCYRWLFEEVEALTANSSFSEARAVALGAPKDRLYRLPMGVPVESIPFHPPSPPASGPFRLLSVGRLEEVKGISFGLRAIRALMDQGHHVQYTVVGEGRLHEQLRDEAEALGIDSVVRFTGALPFREVIEEMRRTHVFVMPGVPTADRQEETQGRALVEAQAVGLPIVASRVGGVPETLGHGAGALVEPGDVAALSEAIGGMLETPELWESMARRGRVHIEQSYDQRVLLDQLVQIYERVRDGGAGS